MKFFANIRDVILKLFQKIKCKCKCSSSCMKIQIDNHNIDNSVVVTPIMTNTKV